MDRSNRLLIAWLLGGLMTLLGVVARSALADVSEEYAELEATVTMLNKSGRYAEAKPLARRLITWAEDSYGDQPRVVALAHWKLGTACRNLHEYAEAERSYEAAIAGLEKHHGRAHAETAILLRALGETYQARARYDAAILVLKRSLEMYQQIDPRSADLPDAVYQLAEAYRFRDNFAEAEPLFRQALQLSQRHVGPEHPFVAKCLHELGVIATRTGRYEEAERHLQRSKEMHLQAGPGYRPSVANNYNSLGRLYAAQGRYAEADASYRASLKIFEAQSVRGPGEDSTLTNLAQLLTLQGRFDEAEGLLRRALAMRISRLGPDHPFVATTLNDMGNVLDRQERAKEAESFYRRALEIFGKTNGGDNVDVAAVMLNLMTVCRKQARLAEAEEWNTRSIQMYEKLLGGQSWQLGSALRYQAQLYYDMERYPDALAAAERAIDILEQQGSPPSIRANAYIERAKIAWKQNRREAALADMQQALSLAEESRLHAAGAEQERAVYFSQYREEFETLLAWQVELKDTEAALRTIERQRARTLLDEMSRGQVDLQAGRSPEERKRLRAGEIEIKGRLATLERQLELAKAKDPRDPAQEKRLTESLAEARRQLYELYRDERSTNPIYRQITKGASSPKIEEIREKLLGTDGLALVYQIGKEAGYVMILSAKDARLTPLALDDAAAKTLGTTAGPLTVERLQEIVMGSKGKPGVAKLLAERPSAQQPTGAELTSRLAVLWQVLIPQAEREALTTGKHRHLLVVPDGPLALVPFEALVVQSADNPEYLLDLGPPIHYAPSLSVLYNLATRPAAAAMKRQAITLADPAYSGAAAPTRGGDALGGLSSRTRYAGMGGALTRLPYTSAESKAVADALKKAGLELVSLQQQYATEAYLRYYIQSREIVHLACHGVTDQAYGNFFGALALAPGPKAATDPSDDGFLTMPEIYELNLKGCELAILSACETNFGPQQQGEGTWALSRGFLIAGARRVIASNWLVDDEATAHLIGRYSALVATVKLDQSINHAEQLQAAKRSIRQQEKWRGPYYWSTFVLLGPE